MTVVCTKINLGWKGLTVGNRRDVYVGTAHVNVYCNLDIIIHDNDKRPCLLVDTGMSGNRNVMQKEAEKMSK